MTHFHPVRRVKCVASNDAFGATADEEPIVCLASDSRHWGCPVVTTGRGPRTVCAGLTGTTWPLIRQSYRWRSAASRSRAGPFAGCSHQGRHPHPRAFPQRSSSAAPLRSRQTPPDCDEHGIGDKRAKDGGIGWQNHRAIASGDDTAGEPHCERQRDVTRKRPGQHPPRSTQRSSGCRSHGRCPPACARRPAAKIAAGKHGKPAAIAA